MSDNGAEGAMFEAFPSTVGGNMDEYVVQHHDNSIDNIGAYDSFAWYGSRWASASTAPGLLYKMYTSEGGIRVPFVIRYPGITDGASKIHPGGIDHSSSTVLDIMPTILGYFGVPHQGATYNGRQVAELAGRSWRRYLNGQDKHIHDDDHVTGWELFGYRALRQGAFKALYIPKPFGPEERLLFNILDDPGETRDLADEKPQKLEALVELYGNYCMRNGVIERDPSSRNQWSKNE